MNPRPRKKIKKRSHINYAYLALAILSWLSVIYIFFFVDPKIWISILYAPFFASILLSIFFTLCLFVKRKIISLLISLGLTAILFLRSLSFTAVYFPILIILIVITMIYFFTTEDGNDKVGSNASKQEKN